MAWHALLITRGETSVEAYINKAMRIRYAEMKKLYKNPYDFGARKNWRMFLGIVGERTFVKNILLPSAHKPIGDGLTWQSIYDQEIDI